MKTFYKTAMLLLLATNSVFSSSPQNTTNEIQSGESDNVVVKTTTFEDVVPVIKEFCPVCLGNGNDLFDLKEIDASYGDSSEDAFEEELSENDEKQNLDCDNFEFIQEFILNKTRKYIILVRLDEILNHCAACRSHPESLSILKSTANEVLTRFKKDGTFSKDVDENYKTLHEGLNELLGVHLKIPLSIFTQELSKIGVGSKSEKKYKLDFCKNKHNLWYLNEK